MPADIREFPGSSVPGIPMLAIGVGVLLAAPLLFIYGISDDQVLTVVASPVLLIVAMFLFAGLTKVDPNQGVVMQLFGAYRGTLRVPGLRWVNPFTTRNPVSLRVRNFDSERLKVNDSEGNPVEIAAVVVWRVVDTAEAVFVVDDYPHYVTVQSEAALRDLATHYPYDTDVDGEIALRRDTAVVGSQLGAQVQERLGRAGVEVLETRISHLAYAPEIASAMLQRQQASAIIAARRRIVDGAVGMVEMAIEGLEKGDIVHLDGAEKARMVSNLLLVLCGDRQAQPMIDTGS